MPSNLRRGGAPPLSELPLLRGGTGSVGNDNGQDAGLSPKLDNEPAWVDIEGEDISPAHAQAIVDPQLNSEISTGGGRADNHQVLPDLLDVGPPGPALLHAHNVQLLVGELIRKVSSAKGNLVAKILPGMQREDVRGGHP